MITEAVENVRDMHEHDESWHRHYRLLLSRGMPEKHARRLAHGKFGVGLALNTDTSFFANRPDAFHDHRSGRYSRKLAKQRAKAAGISIEGKHYFPSLADSPMDPKAWVDSRSDLARLAKQRGVGIEGAGIKVEKPSAPPPSDKPYKVAPDIVAKQVAAVEDEHGALSPKERTDLFQQTQERLSGGQETVDSLEDKVE